MAYIINDELKIEFAKNLTDLKKCKKAYSLVFFTYLVGGVFYILYSILGVTQTTWDWLFYELDRGLFLPVVFFLIIDSLIVAPLAFFLAYRGSLRQHDLCVLFSIALIGANYTMMIIMKIKHFFDHVPPAFIAVSLYSIACIAVSIINIFTNRKYHYLEQQDGFPQFNERFYQQEEDRFQRGIMDEFEQEVSRLKKTSSDSMNDLDINAESAEIKFTSTGGKMDEL